MKFTNIVSIIILLLALASCASRSDSVSEQKRNKLVQENPVVQYIDLYSVDSVFLPLMPDTLTKFKSLKEATQYNLKLSKKLSDFIKNHFYTEEQNDDWIKIRQATSLFDDLQQYIVFKQLKCEPKSLNTINLLSFFSPLSQNNQLTERIEFYNSFPENLKNSEAGKNTWLAFNNYSFDKNIGSKIRQFENVSMSDSGGHHHIFKELFEPPKEYYLIIFGASWCGPCRLNEMQLKQWITKIDTNRLRIAGLSVDGKKKQWLKSLIEDKLPWQSYLLEGEMHNVIVTNLGFNSIPRNFLVSSDGKILVENTDIRKILEYLMKQNR